MNLVYVGLTRASRQSGWHLPTLGERAAGNEKLIKTDRFRGALPFPGQFRQ